MKLSITAKVVNDLVSNGRCVGAPEVCRMSELEKSYNEIHKKRSKAKSLLIYNCT